MRHVTKLAVIFGIALVLTSGSALAHRLVVDDGTHVSAATAIAIADPSISQVAYHEVTAASPSVWFKFNGKAGQSLWTQIGVPKIDRLAAYRPALAVLGPGLPSVSVPFNVPLGYGGWVFTTDSIASPEAFNEFFTGTDSWVFPAKTYTLPSAGTYYVVAFVPSGQVGKMWLTVGQKESFTAADIRSMPETIAFVRKFHEVGTVGGLGFWISLPIWLIRWIFGI